MTPLSTCLVMDAVRFELLILQPMAMRFKLSLVNCLSFEFKKQAQITVSTIRKCNKTKWSRISFHLTSLLLVLSRYISLHSALLPTMPGTTVSRLTVSSPAAESSAAVVAASLSLFDTVHDHPHIQSD
jgi:hypothetical protein